MNQEKRQVDQKLGQVTQESALWKTKHDKLMSIAMQQKNQMVVLNRKLQEATKELKESKEAKEEKPEAIEPEATVQESAPVTENQGTQGARTIINE